MSALEDDRRRLLWDVIKRTQAQIRVYNLRLRADRRAWEQVAYEPRVDYGEQPPLKPGCHVAGDMGWMD